MLMLKLFSSIIILQQIFCTIIIFLGEKLGEDSFELLNSERSEQILSREVARPPEEKKLLTVKRILHND
jgi:hypothetical protein